MTEIITSAYFIVPICIAIIIIAIIVIKRATKNILLSKVEQGKTEGIDRICNLLCTEYSHKQVLRDLPLVKKDSVELADIEVKLSADVVFVGKCGVMLITIIDRGGEYDNPKTGEWKHRYKNSKGEIKIAKMTNPFDSTIPQLRYVSDLLTNDGINGKCVKRLVVMTEKVRTTYTYPEVLSIDELLDTIRMLSENNMLSPAEIRTAVDALYDYADYIENS